MTNSHLTDDLEWSSTVGRVEPEPESERVPCPWCCPAACGQCPIPDCEDAIREARDAK